MFSPYHEIFENITEDFVRFPGQYFDKPLKGDGQAFILFAYAAIQVLQRVLNIFHDMFPVW